MKAALEVYEMLRREYAPDALTDFLDYQFSHDGVVTYRNGSGVAGAAFSWHVSDPWEVAKSKEFPQQDPEGKYLFFPLIYVRPDVREPSGKVLKKLLVLAFSKHPKAKTAVFRRYGQRVLPKNGKRRRRKLPDRDFSKLHFLRVRESNG